MGKRFGGSVCRRASSSFVAEKPARHLIFIGILRANGWLVRFTLLAAVAIRRLGSGHNPLQRSYQRLQGRGGSFCSRCEIKLG